MSEFRSRRLAFDLALVAVLGLFMAACLYAYPSADDFVYGSNVRAGFWNAWLQEYRGWNGRYTSNALVLATPLTFGLAGYRVAIGSMILTTIAAAYVFIRVWAADAFGRREAVTCALVLSSIILSQMPSLGEGLYWYTSAATYEIWIVPALLHLAIVIRHTRLSRRSAADIGLLILGACLLIAVAGFNEVVMLMFVAFYTLWTAAALAGRAPARALVLGFLTISIAGGLLVFLSPGNAVRQSMFAGVRHQLARSLAMTALQTVRFNAEWIANGALVAASILFVPLADAWLRRFPQDRAVARTRLHLLVVGIALVVPIAVFPAYWETNTLGQHRTANTAYMAFGLLWFLAVTMWIASGSRRVEVVRAVSREWRGPLAVALLVALAFTHNGYLIGSDLVSGRLRAFDEAMRARTSALESCHSRQVQVCEVEPIANAPASFAASDVSSNVADWINVGYARYFRLREVKASPQRVDRHVRN